jgi:hypothetical protein
MHGLGRMPAAGAFKPRGRRWSLVLGAEQIPKVVSRACERKVPAEPSGEAHATNADTWKYRQSPAKQTRVADVRSGSVAFRCERPALESGSRRDRRAVGRTNDHFDASV